MDAGIIGYGVYIPAFRIKVEEISKAWKQDFNQIKTSLLIEEKSVPVVDEDSVTLAVNAAKNAVLKSGIEPKQINAIYVGSESKPYAVKPIATIVSQALGFDAFSMAADVEFACKGGTSAFMICLGLVKSGLCNFGMAIGTDTAQAAPGDVLEYSAGAGAAAFILGNDSSKFIAQVQDAISFTTDTPDFWRRSSEKYPEHTGRFTAEPAYFKHVYAIADKIFEKNNCKAEDFDYVVFHQPNGKFPLIAAKALGFTPEQLAPGLVVQKIGNTYSASSLIGLSAVLEQAKADQKILLISYGSGSGCDAFIFKTTKLVEKKEDNIFDLNYYLNQKIYLSYSEYRRHIDSIG
jgi:hydroxymethylglutaryl-CoA synthase